MKKKTHFIEILIEFLQIAGVFKTILKHRRSFDFDRLRHIKKNVYGFIFKIVQFYYENSCSVKNASENYGVTYYQHND